MTMLYTAVFVILVFVTSHRGDEPLVAASVSTYDAELSKLAAEARVNGSPELGQAIGEWYIQRDPERQYLFQVPGVDVADSPWRDDYHWEKFLQLRRKQAGTLWEIADQEFELGSVERALQLVYEILREDPNDERARNLLGFRRRDERWSLAIRTPSVRAGSKQHPKFGWPAGSYWKVDSEHFQIVTNGSEKLAGELVETLEEFYNVWRQLFVRYCLKRPAFQRMWLGRGSLPAGRGKFRVVVFRDREQYVLSLKTAEPNIDISTGVYLHSRRTTFLYAADKAKIMPTWRHEVTHQLLHETFKSGGKVGAKGNFWIIEGIALYMESWRDFGDYVTVGGIDAERLQYARHRALSEGFRMPIADMVTLNRVALQADSRIRRIYSQAAGMAHFLMDGDSARHRESLLLYLRKVYANNDEFITLAEEVGRSYEELDQLYLQYLKVTDERLLRLPDPGVATMFYLGNCQITDVGLESLRTQRFLQWLDLSEAAITDGGVHCLVDHPQIQELNLQGTAISDAAVEILKTLPNLELLNVSKTNVSAAGLRRLLETLPDIEIVK